jgi:hypothetical protein
VYAELTLTLKTPIRNLKATTELNRMIGKNSILPKVAAAGTALAPVIQSALCAEQIPNKANIIYFAIGTDTLVANIFAKSLREIRAQCLRIARQLELQGLSMKKVTATILITFNGSDMAIISGEMVSLYSRWSQALLDRFIGKFVPALVTVFLASLVMAGTTALTSAEIGLVAAFSGAFLDAAISAYTAESWKWKDEK